MASWLSRYVARHATESFDGNGTTYRFPTSGTLTTTVSGWVSGSSIIEWVEYPIGDRPRTMLDESQWSYYPTLEGATHLQLEDVTPASGTANLVMGYTASWTVTDAASDVPDHFEPGFEYALAGAVCRMMATHYGHTGSNTIEADAVDYRSKSAEWLKLADAFFDQAGQVLGVDLTGAPGSGGAGSGVTAAGVFLEWDPKSVPYGRPLFRRRKDA